MCPDNPNEMEIEGATAHDVMAQIIHAAQEALIVKSNDELWRHLLVRDPGSVRTLNWQLVAQVNGVTVSDLEYTVDRLTWTAR